MMTAFDLPDSALDAHDRSFLDHIRTSGWAGTAVGGGPGPAFSYSTGMWFTAQQPEHIILGFSPEIAHAVLWNAYREGTKGSPLEVGRPTDALFEEIPVYVFDVDQERYREFLGWSIWFYRGIEFPTRQLVWPDKQGVFPWQEGFDESMRGFQIDLTRDGWEKSILPEPGGATLH